MKNRKSGGSVAARKPGGPMEAYEAVTKLVITSRRSLAQGKTFGQAGPYEQIDGTAYFAAAPQHPANRLITDLKLAPRDASGRVHYTADCRLLRPVEPRRGNHRLLFDVLNRGKALALRNLNSAPDVAPNDPLDVGNGFLMRQGYTVAWCGCQHDVPEVAGLMRLHAPEALTLHGPPSGKMVVTFQPNVPTAVQFLADGMHRPYPTHDLDDRTAILTEQDHEDAPERIIPRDEWSFARLENGTAGLLSRLAAHGKAPRVLHTYTSSEYWGGHGALVHIDITGSRDLDVPDPVRIYHFGGAQHPLPTFPLQDTDPKQGYRGQQPFNWLDCRPLLRAALVNLDFGPEEGIATHVPPRVGAPYPCLVPAVDPDGNEVCGIRMPTQVVPLATYTGWNVRHPDTGGAGQILASGGASGGTLLGATIPFPATREAREATRDPRRAITERYASKADYLEQVTQAAQALVQERYLLIEDVEEIVGLAAKQYDVLCSQR